MLIGVSRILKGGEDVRTGGTAAAVGGGKEGD